MRLWSWLRGLRGCAPPVHRPPPRVPADRVVYAIGDVHGESALLDQLLGRILRDRAERASGLAATIVFLGDYVDRGPDSRGVMERIVSGMADDCTVHFLMGNHEQAMLHFLDDPLAAERWLAFGGVATLASYGVEALGDTTDPVRLRDELLHRLPPAHLDRLRTLELWVECGDYAFVHAGIRPGQSLTEQSLDDLLWIRAPFLDFRGVFDKVVVHGHTIVPAPQVLNNRIAVDTGAYASGVLSAVALQGDRIRLLQAARS